ncbi:MAG: glycosyltransferase, partial [Acidimicrobiales bacterium]
MTAPRALLELIRWLIGVLLLWRVRPTRHVPTGRRVTREAASATSVVVAGCNRALPANLVSSLEGQLGPTDELIVVDDGASELTAEAARSAGAVVVQAGAVPSGWTGKSWACWRGSQAASGDVLVFLEPDTVLKQGGLSRVLGQRHGAALLSVQPYHNTERPYEQLSAFFNLVLTMGTEAFSVWRDHREQGAAFGPCLVCSRADYQAIGGHGSVRGQVLEDVALARRFCRAGLKVKVVAGRGAVELRMYPAGLPQLVEGWATKLAGGAGTVRPLALLMVLA